MPIRAAQMIVKKLSKQYYSYGNMVASRTYLLLLFSLSFISYFSLPLISKSFNQVITPSIQNNIPLSHISTSLDSQCWHASAHVQFNNFTLARHPPTSYLITEQIRLSHPNQPVTFELLQQAQQIFESITTTSVIIGHTGTAVNLASICYKHQGHCLVHAPPFDQFENEHDWKTKTTIKNTKYETHPYSIYSNATFTNGQLKKADAILLTFVLKQTQHGNTLLIWNKILEQIKLQHHILDMDYPQEQDHTTRIWSTTSNTLPHMIQYKFNLFPYDISYKVQLSMIAYLIVFYFVSMAFGKSNLVRSGHSFGLAAVFLSMACFTTTWGIFDKLGISFHSVPWPLLLLAVNIGSLENIFLLTNAVLNAGCDMIVKEKISRGLQSVGVPMIGTLVAELLILSVGNYMDTALIKEFCTFAKVALLVDYVLQLTFVIAILSIDIKRVELADLDDRQVSKRLHELAKLDSEKKENIDDDFCPIQDTANKEDSRSCAECKDFKTHRVFNAFMLCLIVLGLSMFCSKEPRHHQHKQSLTVPFEYQPDLNQLSDQFWSTVNPEKEVTWLQIQPPLLFIYDNDLAQVQDHVQYLQYLYHAKSNAVRYKPEYRTSLFRMFLLSIVQSIFVMLLSINIPILILCLVMIGIITWMTPTWRKQWLVPLLIHCFNLCILILVQFFQLEYLRRVYNTYIMGHSLDQEKEYDGVHHRGAITVQNIFNQQQYRANVKTVIVKTLTHQHVADIQNLDANAKQSLVSCGQDGHLVLWHANKDKPTWMARLDKLYPSRGGVLQASLNTEFYNSNLKKTRQKKPQKKKRAVSLSQNYLSKARCVKIDAANKWIAAAYDDGVIRVWNVRTGTLVREMDVHPHPVEVHQQEVVEESHLRHRYHTSPKLQSTKAHVSTDRILLLQFMGTITEFCHPLVAEAAAKIKGSDNALAAQNYVVSVHRSGVLHEWDILSGECINTVKTGHTNQITQLLVVDAKAPHRKFGVTWVFTASKDGSVKCWEHRLVTKQTNADDDDDDDDWSGPSVSTHWQLLYTIKQKSAVTSIATELPVGGMGILVTGCSDGSVKVWNFETGEFVCTLSLGKQAPAPSSNQSATSSTSAMSGSTEGIRKFSKFSTNSALLNDTSPFFSSSSDDENDRNSDSSSSKGYSRRTSVSDHRGAIYQVAVTRYCEVENGPGLCRGCDTCFGNGFLIASSAMDDKVHAWRLERSDNGLEGTCTLCTKDYHRKQYKHRKTTSGEDEVHTSRRRRPSHGPVVIRKRPQKHQQQQQTKEEDAMLELLDIEQLAGDVHIPLKPTFLGKIDQFAGRGVVFCDKILAGVRQRRGRRGKQGRWETWFASLQYYDPSVSKSEQEEGRSMRIPIETFDLENDQLDSVTQQLQQPEEDQQNATQVLKGTLLGLFGSSNQPVVKDQLKYKHIHAHTSDSSDEDVKNKHEEDELDEDSLEAGENLPFSAIRHIIPLDGSGLACDFGNFIKLVFLDKPSLSEKELMKQAHDTMETHQRQQRRQRQKMDNVVEEEQDDDSGCQCNDDEDVCNPANKGKDGCCGGANKEKNGGKCCGGNVKQKQKELRKQKILLKPKAPAANVTCGGIRSIAECSLKNNCSRAADCASSNQAITSSTSMSSFNNWL